MGLTTSRRRYLEVRFGLFRDVEMTRMSPVVHDYNLDWHCVPVL